MRTQGSEAGRKENENLTGYALGGKMIPIETLRDFRWSIETLAELENQRTEVWEKQSFLRDREELLSGRIRALRDQLAQSEKDYKLEAREDEVKI